MKKLVVFKKPAAEHKPTKEKKSLDLIWPDVLAHVEKNPKVTNETLFNLFHERSGDVSPVVFQRKCNNRGLREFRKEIQGKTKGGRFKESKAITQKVIDNFKKDRMNRGILHLSKMDVMIERVHKVLDRESVSVLHEEEDNVGIGTHISHLNQAHRLAKDVYRIDAHDKEESSKVNLAIIMNFDPAKPDERQVSGTVIDD